jgi:hypothetical protein
MRRILLITTAIAALLAAGLAQAEVVQRGELRLSFEGRFNPKELPRHRNAPVSIDVSGSISTADGTRPPEVRRIEVGVNRYGSIYTKGLPRCRPGRIQNISTELAKQRCGPAQVGRGSFGANVDFPNEPAFPVSGSILAFNGQVSGRPALLLHIHGTVPVKATIVLIFRITHPAKGNFGTVFTAKIPKIASDLGYVTDISLRLSRRFRHAGERRSYINARCAAPPGFTGGPFSFARGLFRFANGQNLAVTLTRNCRVR